jgi:hypothetical protein
VELCAAPGPELAVLVEDLPSTASRQQGSVDVAHPTAHILQTKQWRKQMTTRLSVRCGFANVICFLSMFCSALIVIYVLL